MRAVVQRVAEGKVTVEEEVVGSIKKGYVVLVGVEAGDTVDDVNYLADKIINLRIFPDEEDKLNLSIQDVQGELLVVSQFTLLGDCRKGRRPSFIKAAAPEIADELYLDLVQKLSLSGLKVETGRFRTDMLVQINNDGPVTILLSSKKEF